MSVEEQAEEAIPAVVRMFSGCEDRQTSADGTFYRSQRPRSVRGLGVRRRRRRGPMRTVEATGRMHKSTPLTPPFLLFYATFLSVSSSGTHTQSTT